MVRQAQLVQVSTNIMLSENVRWWGGAKEPLRWGGASLVSLVTDDLFILSD
jgi:hypothetical protein